MRMSHVGIVGALAVLAMGCESAEQPLEPLQGASLAKGAVVASANGGGKAELPAGFSALEFSFGAIQLGNDRANGTFRMFFESATGTRDFHGKVTCVASDPATGRAWIGGVVTRNNSTNPSSQQPRHQVGEDVWFRVLDDGEGNGVVDRTTVLGFAGDAEIITSAEYCQTMPWADNNANTWPVAAGNIQVR